MNSFHTNLDAPRVAQFRYLPESHCDGTPTHLRPTTCDMHRTSLNPHTAGIRITSDSLRASRLGKRRFTYHICSSHIRLTALGLGWQGVSSVRLSAGPRRGVLGKPLFGSPGRRRRATGAAGRAVWGVERPHPLPGRRLLRVRVFESGARQAGVFAVRGWRAVQGAGR